MRRYGRRRRVFTENTPPLKEETPLKEDEIPLKEETPLKEDETPLKEDEIPLKEEITVSQRNSFRKLEERVDELEKSLIKDKIDTLENEIDELKHPYKKYDIIIVGCGISGIVIAEQFATNSNKNILIIDKRNHIAGNCYDYTDYPTGIRMNKYGAHLFHTNDEVVYEYITKYGEWEKWEHKVVGDIDGSYHPIPANIDTVNGICNENIKNEEEMNKWLEDNQIKYDEIKNGEEMAKSRVGEVLYEKIFKHYTYKQWKKYPEELDPEVLARIPVRNSFDDRYFSDKYQVLPKNGYTHFFQGILDNFPQITLKLNTDFEDLRNQISNEQIVIYTGPIDAYFSDKNLPKLEYRSIDFEIDYKFNEEYYQPNSVVNYPGENTKYTRCVEYKHFLNQKSDHTVIVKETTTDKGEPYYPVLNEKNKSLYKIYQELAEKEGKNVHFLGRLASYKYFNMDQAIKNSLDYYKEHFTKKIFSVFAGRERYMKVLTIYIDKLLEKNLIDEVHIWDFIKNENDRKYIYNLCKKDKYLLKKTDRSTGGPWDEYYKYYYENLNDEDILIKCDDDIVYIDVDTFEEYLISVKNGQFYYPNIVNNDVCAYYQQKYNIHKLFDYDVNFKKWCEELYLVNGYPPPISGGFGLPEPGWFQLFEKASECHKMFLENPKRFKLKNKPLENYASRISVNMFACNGFTAKKNFNKVFEADGDDEAIISGFSKAGNVINLNCTIVHFQFGPQNGIKLDELYLDKYYRYALFLNENPHNTKVLPTKSIEDSINVFKLVEDSINVFKSIEDSINVFKLVIARYNEDISWSNIYAGNRVIYNKGSKMDNSILTPGDVYREISNVGRESDTFLNYIIENYENLPSYVCFSQGSLNNHEWIRKDWSPLMFLNMLQEAQNKGYSNCKTYDIQNNIFGLKFNNKSAYDYDKEKNINDKGKINNFRDFIVKIYPGILNEKKINIFPSSFMVISRDNILKRSKESYKELIQYCNYHINPIEGHYFERSWYYIFNLHLK